VFAATCSCLTTSMAFGEDLVQASMVVTYRQVTDVHLLAVARRHRGRLATLDRGVLALVGISPDDVVLVPVRRAN
jgi:predicted nucleic acid-binding protein